MAKTWTTPPGYLLTDTPTNKADFIAPSTVADFLTGAGFSCSCVNASSAPQLVRYDMQMSNIYEYNENKIKKIIKAFGARYHVGIDLTSSVCADFAVVLTRTPRADLYLKSVLYTEAWNAASRTSCALGVDTNNCPVVLDIASAPHVLIAGTTGSGKSVLLNSIITSLLYKITPSDGQLIMIDPKKTELTAYSDLPHLAAPIVTDTSKAINVLENICAEMSERYSILSNTGVKELSEAPDLFPRLYVVIDELADLMITSRYEVEATIVRIAQLGRAAGIHLIIATQRPTTGILTGLIKANIPTKIALSVSNIADSIAILNHGGAEKLTGRGDAIIKTPDTIIEKRLQSAFTPLDDINRVVNYYKTYKDFYEIQ